MKGKTRKSKKREKKNRYDETGIRVNGTVHDIIRYPSLFGMCQYRDAPDGNRFTLNKFTCIWENVIFKL